MHAVSSHFVGGTPKNIRKISENIIKTQAPNSSKILKYSVKGSNSIVANSFLDHALLNTHPIATFS